MSDLDTLKRPAESTMRSLFVVLDDVARSRQVVQSALAVALVELDGAARCIVESGVPEEFDACCREHRYRLEDVAKLDGELSRLASKRVRLLAAIATTAERAAADAANDHAYDLDRLRPAPWAMP